MQFNLRHSEDIERAHKKVQTQVRELTLSLALT
jgi:hypothetical protein